MNGAYWILSQSSANLVDLQVDFTTYHNCYSHLYIDGYSLISGINNVIITKMAMTNLPPSSGQRLF